MKKSAKAFISILLCLILAIGVALPSFAKSEKTAFIVVSGMNSAPLYCDGQKVFGPETSVIMSAVMKSLPSLAKFLTDGNYDSLADGMFPAVKSIFEKLSCNPDGTSVYNVESKQFFDRASEFSSEFASETKDEFAIVRAGMEAFGAENTYFFNYDWRLSPLDHAEALHKFIQMVKEKDDYDRISMVAYSMGGTVVCSYLSKYGSSDIDAIALCSTAFQGTTSVGALFTGAFNYSMGGMMRRFAELTRSNFFEDFLNCLNTALNDFGINACIDSIANSFAGKLNDRIYEDVIIPVFGYMPGLWAMVDSDEYTAAKKFMLDENLNSALIEKIDEYKYNVQDKAEELLKDAQKDTNIYITAQYNRQGLPVSVASSTSNNDNLIDTRLESGGAVCSLLGETLGENYTQKIDCGHNHISYDNNIDASTCMFPEQTWFVKNMMHVDYPYGDSTDFIIWLMQSETQLTVHSSEKYPQFLIYDCDSNTLSPLAEQQSTIADIIFGILSKIIDTFSEIISMIIY